VLFAVAVSAMLGRGTKRKPSSALGGDEPLSSGYARNLSNFQTMARRRESLRVKQQALVGGSSAAEAEKRLKSGVAREMAIMEGAAKLIAACGKDKRRVPEALEAGKTLLTARLRSDMVKFELNKLRRGRGSPPSHAKQGRPSYAALSLSDVRMPLTWRPRDHIDDVGDGRRFAVFLLARIGAQIYDSGLLHPVDRHEVDLIFKDVLLFNQVPPYFELTLELYSHCLDVSIVNFGLALSMWRFAGERFP